MGETAVKLGVLKQNFMNIFPSLTFLFQITVTFSDILNKFGTICAIQMKKLCIFGLWENSVISHYMLVLNIEPNNMIDIKTGKKFKLDNQ